MRKIKYISVIVEGLTDKIYIDKILKEVLSDYLAENKTKLDIQVANGKGSLIRKSNESLIKIKKNNFKNYEIIITTDMDEYKNKEEDRKKFDEIREHTQNKGFHFVFFNRDIEDVLEITVKKGALKKKAAERYNPGRDLKKKIREKLKINGYSKSGSNLFLVLSEILEIEI